MVMVILVREIDYNTVNGAPPSVAKTYIMANLLNNYVKRLDEKRNY